MKITNKPPKKIKNNIYPSHLILCVRVINKITGKVCAISVITRINGCENMVNIASSIIMSLILVSISEIV